MSYKGFTRTNLLLKDYVWNDYEEGDERVSGSLDNTLFDRTEGNEMLFMINALMELWGLDKAKNGQKIERMIKTYLPYDITSQIAVKDWVKQNWKFY